MTMPTTLFGPRDTFVGGALAHPRFAGRLPLRVSCRCRAHWDHADLEDLCFDRDVELGSREDLAAAMTLARAAVAADMIPSDHDAALRLVPRSVTILDAEQCLVLAGDVKGGGIHWCNPVGNDAEARRVVGEACALWVEARSATEAGNPDAAALLSRAHSLEGRLVEAFWRERATAAVDRTLVA